MLESLLRLFEPPLAMLARLYQSDITPQRSDSADLYILAEADFTGYVAQVVPVWSAITESSNVATSEAFPIVFQAATPILLGNSIFGYFVSPQDDPTQVLWAERFTGAPYGMTSDGQTLLLYLKLSEQSVYP